MEIKDDLKIAGRGGRNGAGRWLFYPLKAALLLVAATLLGYAFRQAGFPETNVVLLYILAVFVTSSQTRGYSWGILSSIAATLTFNYFFTKPYHSLNVYDASYMATFAVMTIVAIVTSMLTSRVKENAEKATRREWETQVLYHLTSRLSEARELSEAAEAAVKSAGRLLDCSAAFLCFDEEGNPEKTFLQQSEDGKIVRRKLSGLEEIKGRLERIAAGCEAGEEFLDYPVYGEARILGAVRIPKEKGELDGFEERFLHSLQECMALALDRILAVRRQESTKRQAEQERYRGNLLRAISHDLRTPLSGIMGTSEMIMDMTVETDERYALARGIRQDAQWLHALVENILSLTRLQEGRMVINKQPEAAEEIVGSSVAQMEKRAPGREISVEVPDEVLMVPMDGKLIMQVLINLLDNAVKHTGPGQEIRVHVRKDVYRDEAVFSVSDRGEGIASEDLPNVFETFYTSKIKPVDAQRGIGLGLAICHSIISQHGGRMEARNRTDGPGAEFIFTLPLAEKKEENDDGAVS